MGVPYFKVIWTPQNWSGALYLGPAGQPRDITEIINWNHQAGLDAKANMATIDICNAWAHWSKGIASDQNSNPFFFKYRDLIEIYADYKPIDTTAHGNSSQLVFAGFVQEVRPSMAENKRDIQVKLMDKTVYLLNRLWSYPYGNKDNFTPPQLVKKIVDSNVLDQHTLEPQLKAFLTDGTKADGTADVSTTLNGALSADSNGNTTVGGKQSINVGSGSVFSNAFVATDGIVTINNEQIEYETISGNTLVGITRGANRSTIAAHSNGATVYKSGYIQSKTQPTTGNHLENGVAFNPISIAAGFVPVYEWLTKISSREYISAINTLVHSTRPYNFYVDRFGYIRWFYPYQNTDFTLTEGQNQIISMSLSQSMLNAYNMLIFDAGTDALGRKVLWYKFNEKTLDKELKIKFQPLIQLSTDLKAIEKQYFLDKSRWDAGVAPTCNNYKIDVAFPDSWPSNYKASWAGTTTGRTTWPNTYAYNSNVAYNTDLRTVLKEQGESKAQTYMGVYAFPLWTGQVMMKGTTQYRAGMCVQVTSVTYNFNNKLLRVTDVQQDISSKGWYTTLILEEDPTAVAEY